MALVDAGHAGHDLAGSAIAALESITLYERRLQRMELIALGQALDGGDLATFHQSGERQTGLYPLTVHQDRAGATLTEPAAFFRAGELQVLAQCIEQCGPRIEREPVLGAIDPQ